MEAIHENISKTFLLRIFRVGCVILVIFGFIFLLQHIQKMKWENILVKDDPPKIKSFSFKSDGYFSLEKGDTFPVENGDTFPVENGDSFPVKNGDSFPVENGNHFSEENGDYFAMIHIQVRSLFKFPFK